MKRTDFEELWIIYKKCNHSFPPEVDRLEDTQFWKSETIAIYFLIPDYRRRINVFVFFLVLNREPIMILQWVCGINEMVKTQWELFNYYRYVTVIWKGMKINIQTIRLQTTRLFHVYSANISSNVIRYFVAVYI